MGKRYFLRFKFIMVMFLLITSGFMVAKFISYNLAQSEIIDEHIHEKDDSNTTGGLLFDNNSEVDIFDTTYDVTTLQYGMTATVKDRYGITWKVYYGSMDSQQGVWMEYVSGKTNCYIPVGGHYTAYDYSYKRYVSFTFYWGGTALLDETASRVILNSSCKAYLDNDVSSGDVIGGTIAQTGLSITSSRNNPFFTHPCDDNVSYEEIEKPASCTHGDLIYYYTECEWCLSKSSEDYYDKGNSLGHDNTVTGTYYYSSTSNGTFSYRTCSRDGWTKNGNSFTSSETMNEEIEYYMSDYGAYFESVITFTVTNSSSSVRDIYFDYVASCEENYDMASVYVDGSTTPFVKLSGEKSGNCRIPVSNGSHTVTFIYTKDDSGSEGTDSVTISNLQLKYHTHTYVQSTKLYQAATCCNPAFYEQTCSGCGFVGYYDSGSELGHANATYTYGDFTYVTCTRTKCGWSNSNGVFTSKNSGVPGLDNEDQSIITFTTTLKYKSKISFNFDLEAEYDTDCLYAYLTYPDGTTKSNNFLDPDERYHYSGYYEYDNLEAGTYTLKFIYYKDGSVDEGLDRAEISNLKITTLQADGYVTLDKTNDNVDYKTESTTFNVTSYHGGDLSASTNNSIVKASVSGTKVTVTGLNTLDVGTSVVVTVKSAITSTHKEASAIYTVKIANKIKGNVKILPPTISIEYGTTETAVSIVSNHGGTLSVSDNNDIAGVTLNGTQIKFTNLARISAGTSFVATVTCAETNNYLAATATCTVTILQKEIGITWSNLEFTYDKQFHVPTATATGLVNGDACTITVTGEDINAGTWTACADSLSNSNYCLPDDVEKDFVIKPIKLSGIDVRIYDVSEDEKYVGRNTITYTGNPYIINGVANGLLPGDSTEVFLSPYSGREAKTYEVTVEITNTNYYYDPTITWTITKANMTVEQEGYTGTYDAQEHTGTLDVSTVDNSTPTIYYAIGTELTESNYLTDGTKTIPTHINVNENVIKVYYYIVETNHNSASGYYEVKIDKATLDVIATPNAATLTYTGESALYEEGYTFTVAGLLGDDTKDVITFDDNAKYYFSNNSYSESIIAPANVDTYQIRLSELSASADNYLINILFEENTLVIQKANLIVTVTPNPCTVTYTGLNAVYEEGYTYDAPGLLGGDSKNVITITGTPTYKFSSDTYSENTTTPINAGNYNILINNLVGSADNYEVELNYATNILTINKADSVITLEKYSDTVQYPNTKTAKINSVVGDGELSVSTNSSNATVSLLASNTYPRDFTIIPTAVGTAIIIVSISEGENYNASYVEYNLEVIPGSLDGLYTVSYYNAQYDGKEHSITVSTNVPGAIITYSDSETGVYSNNLSDYSYINVTGTYKEVWYKISAPNYEDAIGSSTVTITARKLTATVTPNTYEPTYTGEEIPFTNGFTITYDRLIDGDTITVSDANVKYTYSGSEIAPTNVNTYIIEMLDLYLSNENYEITTTYKTGTMRIKKFQVTIPTALSGTITYDGKEHEYIPNNLDLTYCDITENVYKDAGNYSVSVTLKNTANTEWTDSTTGIRAFNFTVQRMTLEITVTVNSNSHVYNGSVNYVKGYEITNNTELAEGDTLDSILSKTGTPVYKANGKDFVAAAGEYVVTLTGLTITSTNYNITKRTNVNGTYTITKADLYNIEYSSDLEKVYDGTPLDVRVSADSINGQTVSYNYSVTPSRTNAGETDVTCTIKAPNHNDKVVNYTIKVTKKDITIVVKPAGQESVYTGNLSYTNSNNYKITSVNSLVTTDLANIVNNNYSTIIELAGNPSFTFAGSTVMPQNVGTYEIRMGGLSATADNYTITSIEYGVDYLKIKEATLNVTAQGYTGTYDGLTHTGTVNVSTIAGQTAKIYYSTVSQIDANSKTEETIPTFRDVRIVDGNVVAYTVYYLVSAPNHYDVEGTFNVLINKNSLTITVTPNNYEDTYSNAVVYPGGYAITAINGLLSGDTKDVITFTGTPLYKFGKEATGYTTAINQNAGVYEITMENVVATANNYNVSATFAKGTLTINKKDIASSTPELSTYSVVYNGTEQKLVPTVSINLVSGNANVLLVDTKDYTLSYANVVNVGEAVITITGTGNYTGTTEITYEITPADITPYASELAAKNINILTVDGQAVRLTRLSDINLTNDKNSYGQWVINEDAHVLTSVIYSTTNKYTYEISMIFESSSTNYNNCEGTLVVTLDKNTVEFSLLTPVDVTYNNEEIEAPVYEIKYFNDTYNGTPKIQYYKGGNTIDYVPTNAGTYQYRVICNATEYYEYKESSLTSITISAKDITDLTYSGVAAQTYTGSAIKPEVEVKFNDYVLTTNDMSINYSNNTDAITKSGVEAVITIAGKGNYIGTKEITFTINPKAITSEMVSKLASYEYNEQAITPTVVVTDAERNTALVNSEAGDFTVAYTNNVNVGTAQATVSGRNNYTGTVVVEFTITKGTFPANKIPTVGVLTSTVDALLTTLNAQLAAYNGNYGAWMFWDNNNECAYPEDQIVASSVGTGTVTFGIKFVPGDVNYNEVLDREVTIIVNLNDSKVEFSQENIQFVYTTNKVEFTSDFITKLDANNQPYEEEFNNDKVTFNYFDEAGEAILTPVNAGTYQVEVVVAANRKYKEARTTTTFKITPRDINEVTVVFTDMDENESDYQYTTIAITPSVKATYANDILNSKNTDFNVSYENNVAVSTVSSKAVVILTGNDGNYTGEKRVEFNIVPRDLSTLTVNEIADQFYTGTAIKPAVTIFNNNTLLTTDDYTAVYADNTNPGTALITIVANKDGNYKGSTTATFIITNKPIDPLLLPEIVNKIEVVGTKLSDVELTSNEYGSWSFVLLETNADATVGAVNPTGNTFELVFNPTEVSYSPVYDKISIIVIRMTANLLITDASLNKTYDREANSIPNYVYDGDASKITMTYYKNGMKLDECPKDAGTYKVVLSAAQTDNYEAVEAEIYFTISKAVIGVDAIVTPIESQNAENGKQLTPEVVITHDDYKLVLNSDYNTIYGPNAEPGEGYVLIIGMKNYTTEASYYKETFDILAPVAGGLTISEIADQTYTGEAIEPEFIVLFQGDELESTQYTYEFINNTNVTTQAKLTVTATISDVEYTNSVTFKILALEIQPENVVVSDTTVGTNPTITVTVNGKELTLNTDYAVQIGDVSNEGESNVTVFGKGNYSGEIVRTFTVSKVQPTILKLVENSKIAFYKRVKTSRSYTWEEQEHTEMDTTGELVIRNVATGQKIDKLLEQFENSLDRLKIYKDHNLTKEVVYINSNTNQYNCINNGATIVLYDEDMVTVLDKVTIIVAGDVNNDGKLTSKDRLAAYKYLYDKDNSNLTIYQQYAIDINVSRGNRCDAKINDADISEFDNIITNKTSNLDDMLFN